MLPPASSIIHSLPSPIINSISICQQQMSEEDSCYSNDEEYFLDVCRAGEMEELVEFVKSLPSDSTFNWAWFNNQNDNFMHMLAANNFHQIFDFLVPVLQERCPPEQLLEIVNKTNSSGSTPLHYTIITDSKEMVERLLKLGADTNITNDQGRTPFQQAEKFEKFQIAQILAPVTGNRLDQLKKQVEGMKLNDNDDDEDESDEEKQKLEEIQQKEEGDAQ